MEERKYIEEQYDEIDIMELVRKLLKSWKFILMWCGIAAVVGLIIGFSIPKEYTVSSKLAPEVASKNGGSISSLASLAGINLNNMNTSDAVYPDLYPEIVASAPFIVDLFSMPVEFMHKKDTVRTDLYDYVKNYTRVPWWSVVIGAPMKAVGWFVGLFREKEEEVEGYENINPVALTFEQEQIANAIRESISVIVDKKTTVITATVVTQDASVSRMLTEELISRLQDYVSTYRTEKSRNDVDYYQKLYDEAKGDYYASQKRYAKYVDANQGVVLQSVKTEQDRLKNEVDLNFQLYTSCAQQLQMAKAKVQMETPVYTVINPPTTPLKASKPSKLTLLVAFIFLGAVFSGAWVLWGRDWVAKLK